MPTKSEPSRKASVLICSVSIKDSVATTADIVKTAQRFALGRIREHNEVYVAKSVKRPRVFWRQPAVRRAPRIPPKRKYLRWQTASKHRATIDGTFPRYPKSLDLQ